MSRCTCTLDTCLQTKKCSGILRSILARRLHKLPDCMWITGSWKKCASTNHAVTMTVATSILVRTLKRTTQDCIHTVWQGFVRYLAPHVPSPPAYSVLFSQSSRESPSGICRQGMYSLAQAEESLHASLWFSTGELVWPNRRPMCLRMLHDHRARRTAPFQTRRILV